jgi:hypothetical protein
MAKISTKTCEYGNTYQPHIVSKSKIIKAEDAQKTGVFSLSPTLFYSPRLHALSGYLAVAFMLTTFVMWSDYAHAQEAKVKPESYDALLRRV